jgi:MFS family permease
MEERRRVLAVVSTVLLFSVLVWFNYSAVLPLVVEEWSLSGTQAGVVFAAFQAGYVLAILPAGRLADRTSTRRVIAAGATATGVFSLGFAVFAQGFLSGVALRFLAGVGMAGVYVPGMRFLADWFPPERRGRALGVYTGAFSLSTGLSFLLSSGIASVGDWRVGIGATSVGAVLAGPVMLAATADPPEATSAAVGFDLSMLRNRAYRYAVGVYAGHTWEVFGVRNWLPAFLVSLPAVAAADDPTFLAGILTGVTLSVGGVGNVAGGWASDRIGRSRAVFVALGTSGAISLGVAFLGGISLPLLVGLLVVYGVVLVADSSPTSTAVTEVVDDEHVGVALAVQTLVGFTMTVVSPVVFGVVLDARGFSAAFPTFALGAVGGLVSLALLARARGAGRPSGAAEAAD